MRFTEALSQMYGHPMDTYHRRGCLEIWRFNDEIAMLEMRFNYEDDWSSEVVISQEDLRSDRWEELYAASVPVVSPKNNSAEFFAADLVERTARLEEHISRIDRAIQLLDSRISGHVKVTSRRLESQDNVIGNHIICQERNTQCQDHRINELELAINKLSCCVKTLEEYHQIVTSNLLRLSLRLDKLED